MKLKEVRWEDPDGDKYEGILFGEFKASCALGGEGLFMGNPLQSEVVAHCVIQTAYHPNRRTGGACKEAPCDEIRAPKLEEHLNQFLREYIRYRIRLVSERIFENFHDSLNTRIFENLDRLEIVSDFDYLSHLTSLEQVPRFLALYQYSLENIDTLIEEYKNKTLDQLLIDDRVRRVVEFMGKKGEETYELTKEIATTAEQFLTHLKKLIAFYL